MTKDAIPNLLLSVLQSSLNENTPVSIIFRSGEMFGIVTKIENDIVEIRHDDRRSAIRIDSIDAVTMK